MNFIVTIVCVATVTHCPFKDHKFVNPLAAPNQIACVERVKLVLDALGEEYHLSANDFKVTCKPTK
jgi:hypothetical protein